MQETLKRDLSKTYLIISSEGVTYDESYELEMLLKNELQTMLPLHVTRVDGVVQLFYDVSAKQTLRACTQRGKLNADTIEKLFRAIAALECDASEYLLDMESVLLDFEHIYIREGQFYFCYCPWMKKEALCSFRGLLEELLGEVDYHDTKGVEMAYHLYQKACRGNFDIGEILEEHCRKEKEPKKEHFPGIPSFVEDEQSSEIHVEEAKASEKKQKKKIGKNKILQFFLNKQPKEEKVEEESVEELFSHKEMEVFKEESWTDACTTVLESEEAGTTILGDVSFRSWRLRPLQAGYEEFCITGDDFVIGKKRGVVDGYIGRNTISRIHSRLWVKQDRLFLLDSNSTNGVCVNGRSIEPGTEVEIFAGDRILFADVEYECYNSL